MLRRLIRAGAGLLALFCAMSPAFADYPERPVTILVGFPHRRQEAF
jgi:hypothetical protein